MDITGTENFYTVQDLKFDIFKLKSDLQKVLKKKKLRYM